MKASPIMFSKLSSYFSASHTQKCRPAPAMPVRVVKDKFHNHDACKISLLLISCEENKIKSKNHQLMIKKKH
jgi:hypothetical protein